MVYKAQATFSCDGKILWTGVIPYEWNNWEDFVDFLACFGWQPVASVEE